MDIEPNVVRLTNKLRACKKVIYVPFIEGISFKIVKYRLPVTNGAFNISSCSNSHEFIKKIDLAIVPALGIDSKFHRIGFGKGMYDRFFASIHKRPLILFVQRELCFNKAVIGESHDISGDYLVLPNKIMKRGRLKNAYNSVNGYGSRRLVRTGRIFCSKEDRFRKIPNIHRAIKIKS